MEGHNTIWKSNNDVSLKRVTLNYFNNDFEKKFRINYFRKSISVFRLSVFTTILLYAGFGLLDKVSSPNFLQQFQFVRFAVVIPLLLVVLGLSYMPVFKKIWQSISAIILFIAGLGIIYMLHRDPNNLYYYGGLFLIFMGGYFFLKLRFFMASITGISLILAYGIVYFIMPQTSGTSVIQLVSAIAFFVASNIICMIGLYSIERLERIDFFKQKLLSDKNAEIEKINLNLEKKINSRTKDLIKAKEKAEESDRLKSAFLANMSHEIRTPMNGILGFSGLLKEPGLTGERQQQYIQIIEKSGTRMLNIINDIISISKIESGLMELNITESSINNKLEYIYTFFRPEAEAKGITLSFKNNLPSKEVVIKTDSEKLDSILTNLVKNAIKYTAKGSIEFGYSIKGEQFEFYVKDTGVGIDEDRQIAIFERFIQADIDDIMARQGAGLGLSISKAYVEILGGKLWVESKKDIGSTFYFTIPYNEEKIEINRNAENQDTKDISSQIKKLKILIVEDDETSNLFLNTILKEQNTETISANNGNEAIRLCRENPDLDLILMDIKMPVMDGYEATRQIREFNKDVVIIAQTAHGLAGDREKAMVAGCNEHIPKPIEKKKLMSLIEQYFKN